ncbi:MAG: element excision factor XisH family protein [Microcystaceae cyanobacterium]
MPAKDTFHTIVKQALEKDDSIIIYSALYLE